MIESNDAMPLINHFNKALKISDKVSDFGEVIFRQFFMCMC